MTKAYIVAIQRSAVGRFLGTLAPLSPAELGATVMAGTLQAAGIDGAVLDEVIVGNVLNAGHGHNVGRQAALRAGIPQEVPAQTVNMVCGSGLKTMMSAAALIKAGMADLVLAGGTESMSQAGYVTDASARAGAKLGDLALRDVVLVDGLLDAIDGYHMGVTAENVAKRYGITREQCDEFALESQTRALAAIDSGVFTGEIVPVTIAGRKGDVVFDTDEHPFRGTSLEKLAKLRPAFDPNGVVTAGNASGINDGAAFAVLASEDAVARHGLTPLVEFVAGASAGLDPAHMGLGPVPATAKVLATSGLQLTDLDVLELNEAFAAQSLGVLAALEQEHGVDREWFDARTNLHGGAIALGHPLGASGARITTTLVHEMVRSGARHGLATLCIGGGLGVAAILAQP
ncbi:MAG: acetyl-CoA C-acetyltransferase [Candidatus Nanopelagicales bacterium]